MVITMEYCSAEVSKGVEWLEKYLVNLISDYKDSKKKKCLIPYVEYFYCLYKVNINHPLVSELIEHANNEDFWTRGWLWDNYDYLYYLAKIGLDKNESFLEVVHKYIKDEQTVKGYLHSNDNHHTGPMRVLIAVEPESEPTKMAVKYFIDNYEEYIDYPENLSSGILALSEYDFYRYIDIIRELSEILKKMFSEEGYIKSDYSQWKIQSTSLALQALSSVFGNNDATVKRGIKWLKENQNLDGSWCETIHFYTSDAVLGLITAGEGPKISKEECEQKELIYIQKIKTMKSEIIITSPFTNEFGFKIKINEMIANTNNRLWICSRFITECWTDIITLKKKRPEIDVRIVTIPKKEANQKYIGDGKKFVEPAFDALQRFLGNNFKTTSLLHARCVIIDDTVLISSTDLTNEQMEKEFNLGISSRDPEIVNKSVEIFETFWKNIYEEKN